jgi:flagellar basal body rod protein FlgF
MTIQASAPAPVMTITISASDDVAATGVPPPTTTRAVDGSVNFANQNYNINVSENGDININNKQTNEAYLIQNDLHVKVDGVRAFYFEGTTSFELDDGTRITIDTAPRKAIDYAMLAATSVAIFDGRADYAVLIENLDRVREGEITFEEVVGDAVVELIVDTGNQLDENLDGEGFVAIDDHGNIQSVDQEWIHNTDEIQIRTRGLFNQYSSMVNFISGVTEISFSGTLLSMASQDTHRAQDNHPKAIKRDFRPQVKFEPEDAMVVANAAAVAKRRPDDRDDEFAKEPRQRFSFVLSRSLRAESFGR